MDKKYTCHEELKTSEIGREVYMTSGRKATIEERAEIIEFCISNGKISEHHREIQHFPSANLWLGSQI